MKFRKERKKIKTDVVDGTDRPQSVSTDERQSVPPVFAIDIYRY
jgi:hypothetical protein